MKLLFSLILMIISIWFCGYAINDHDYTEAFAWAV
jgi:hypothetical protein